MRNCLFFSLLLLSIKLSAQDCAEIIERIPDKFEKKVTFYTPLLRPVSFSKIIKNGSVFYSMSLTVYDDYLSISNKGVIILLGNGKRINKPLQEVNEEVNEYRQTHDSDYVYTAYIRLTPADIAILKTHKITDFKLGIFEGGQTEEEQVETLQHFSCLLNAK